MTKDQGIGSFRLYAEGKEGPRRNVKEGAPTRESLSTSALKWSARWEEALAEHESTRPFTLMSSWSLHSSFSLPTTTFYLSPASRLLHSPPGSAPAVSPSRSLFSRRPPEVSTVAPAASWWAHALTTAFPVFTGLARPTGLPHPPSSPSLLRFASSLGVSVHHGNCQHQLHAGVRPYFFCTQGLSVLFR